MSNVMQRTFAALELLARHPEGLSVGELAKALNLPASAAHRLLTDLASFGYVRQLQAQGAYALTIRLAGIGLAWLGRAGVVDVAQPELEDLARLSGELVRLSVFDAPDLRWLGVAQGAVSGLRYDPGREQGGVASLAYSAGGRAWLMALSDDEALRALAVQGMDLPEGSALARPMTLGDVMADRQEALARGYAVAVDCYLAGMAAMAVPVRNLAGQALGCLSIAGPGVRMTPARMEALAAPLAASALRIGDLSAGSAFFRGRG